MKILGYVSLICFLVAASFMATSTSVFATRAIEGEIDWNPKEVVVGDRIDISAKIFLWNKVPLTQDLSYKIEFKDAGQGRSCTMTDKTLKDDATVRGYCESKKDAGKMSIVVVPESANSIFADGTDYSPYPSLTIEPTFRDTKDCGAQIAPTSVTLTKQNTVEVKVAWQHIPDFLGTYQVLVGTVFGQFPTTRETSQKDMVIDTPNIEGTYYVKVRAKSPCKWVADSPVYAYVPKTGKMMLGTQKPTSLPSPKVTASPKPIDQTPVPVFDDENTESAAVQPSATPSSGEAQDKQQSWLLLVWNFCKSLLGWK